MRLNRHNKGFTLIEMAIVLVIIGIILAGVMKGRDIVRGSQVKQFSQQFAQKWQTVAQTYFDKTGQMLNDGPTNGGAGTMDFRMDGAAWGTEDNIVDVLRSVGITPCTIVKSKVDRAADPWGLGSFNANCDDGTAGDGMNLFVNIVDGEYSGAANVSIDLINLFMEFANGDSLRRNCVVFYGVPTDVAKGLDTAIDGIVNGEEGAMVNLEDWDRATGPATQTVSPTTGGTAIELQPWPSAEDGNLHTVALIMDY